MKKSNALKVVAPWNKKIVFLILRFNEAYRDPSYFLVSEYVFILRTILCNKRIDKYECVGYSFW